MSKRWNYGDPVAAMRADTTPSGTPEFPTPETYPRRERGRDADGWMREWTRHADQTASDWTTLDFLCPACGSTTPVHPGCTKSWHELKAPVPAQGGTLDTKEFLRELDTPEAVARFAERLKSGPLGKEALDGERLATDKEIGMLIQAALMLDTAQRSELDPAYIAHLEADLRDRRRRISSRLEALEQERDEARLLLGDAAREIPWVAGPVAHRIRLLRQQHAADLEAATTAKAQLEQEKQALIEGRVYFNPFAANGRPWRLGGQYASDAPSYPTPDAALSAYFGRSLVEEQS